MASFTPINQPSGSSKPRKDTKRRSKSTPDRVHGTPVTSANAGTQKQVIISKETVMQERAKHGLEQLLRQAMDAHTDPGSRAQTARNAIEVFAEVREMSDEGISRIWTDYVETEQLWDMFGGLEAFKTIVDYEHVVEPARVRYSATVGRKDRARAKIKVHWGEHWEEEFDPQEFRLRQFSEHFLRHLAAIAKDGWSMQQA